MKIININCCFFSNSPTYPVYAHDSNLIPHSQTVILFESNNHCNGSLSLWSGRFLKNRPMLLTVGHSACNEDVNYIYRASVNRTVINNSRFIDQTCSVLYYKALPGLLCPVLFSPAVRRPRPRLHSRPSPLSTSSRAPNLVSSALRLPRTFPRLAPLLRMYLAPSRPRCPPVTPSAVSSRKSPL